MRDAANEDPEIIQECDESGDKIEIRHENQKAREEIEIRHERHKAGEETENRHDIQNVSMVREDIEIRRESPKVGEEKEIRHDSLKGKDKIEIRQENKKARDVIKIRHDNHKARDEVNIRNKSYTDNGEARVDGREIRKICTKQDIDCLLQQNQIQSPGKSNNMANKSLQDLIVVKNVISRPTGRKRRAKSCAEILTSSPYKTKLENMKEIKISETEKKRI